MSHERTNADSDATVIRRITEGDRNAVGELYDRYASMLLPLALRILRDRAESEDIVHDAFVLVSDRASQYVAERGSVAAWLVTLVRNLAIDRTRRRDRRGSIARDVVAHEPQEKADDPETLTAAASERAKIRRALGSLPEAQRTTLEIAFFEGLSYPEIAEREGVPLGTIKSRAARALGALREALDREVVSLEDVPQKLGTASARKGAT
ncbi:MAG: sigma-70 family RNA polymerase sigma factor [Polyangiaceae bacterium]